MKWGCAFLWTQKGVTDGIRDTAMDLTKLPLFAKFRVSQIHTELYRFCSIPLEEDTSHLFDRELSSRSTRPPNIDVDVYLDVDLDLDDGQTKLKISLDSSG